ncbi:Galactosylceramide sulfotransferase [Chionoecetes opilio]|uniref:Galactosylceramide sulfotransferase n=1 Tax=Chionoecetes opilio TaxID=41210 RepID=A0A8J4YB17_CHIOP|nr:Galactosylceramide sulfotransferase [Chionoecetes opilio]
MARDFRQARRGDACARASGPKAVPPKVWVPVREADDHFGLVMVSDRMEESLVLLAQYLCWELSDVLVLISNSLSKEYKTGVSAETRQTLQQKLAPDYLLYRHFLARLDQQVEAFGRDRMAAEVARLREMMALLVNTCNFVSKKAMQLSGTQRPWSSPLDGGQKLLPPGPTFPFLKTQKCAPSPVRETSGVGRGADDHFGWDGAPGPRWRTLGCWPSTLAGAERVLVRLQSLVKR